MKAFCDLHIHSCLSPCADDDMTPWNIVGMAKLKGLDVIALTDHNSTLNLPEAMAAASALGMQLVPGVEVTTREEVHVLGYFDTVTQALAFGVALDEHLPMVKNQPLLFGRQIIIGHEDEEAGEVEKLLINATDLSVEEVCSLIGKYAGVAVPAHINRGSNGMIGALGLMPMLPEYPVVEVYPGVDCPAYATKGRFVLHASDAHQLGAIQEPDFTLDVEEKTADGVLECLRKQMS